MNRLIILIFAFFLCMISTSCGEGNQESLTKRETGHSIDNRGILPEQGIVEAETQSGMMPDLKTADSVAVMFYDTPDNPRFFGYTKIFDLRKMDPVIMDINAKVIDPGSACATRGKIYFYGKRNAVYVVYFSEPDSCLTFSFIKTGEKYFVKMSKRSQQLLNTLRPLAKEPEATN